MCTCAHFDVVASVFFEADGSLIEQKYLYLNTIMFLCFCDQDTSQTNAEQIYYFKLATELEAALILA